MATSFNPLFSKREITSPIRPRWRQHGFKITRVDGTDPTIELVEEFDTKAFKKEQPEQYKLYTKTVEKKKSGRSGYVKVTFPKSGT